MGLTIHWNLKYKGTQASVLIKLYLLKTTVASILPKVKQEPLWKLDYSINFNDEKENIKQAGKEYAETYRWAKIQLAPRDVIKDRTYYPPKDYNQYRGYVVRFWVGAGCEPTNIGLISCDNKDWIGHGFSKTQYAEHFLQAHLSVIKILDVCKALDILKEVSDEGEYWESRDLKKLAKEINASTVMIESLSKTLKSKWNKSVVVSSIDKSKNYLHVRDSKRFLLKRKEVK